MGPGSRRQCPPISRRPRARIRALSQRAVHRSGLSSTAARRSIEPGACRRAREPEPGEDRQPRGAQRDCSVRQPADRDRRRPRSDHGRAGVPAADVRSTARSLAGLRVPGSRARAARHGAAAADQRAFIEAFMVGLNTRDGPRAAVARLSDRSTRHLLPAVLGHVRGGARRSPTSRRSTDGADRALGTTAAASGRRRASCC